MADTKIVFLVLPKVHLLDLAGPDQVFNEAMEQGAKISLHYCSFAQPLATSSHLPFGKLQHFSKININKGDYLFIPGAELSYLYSPELKKEKAVFKWVIEAHKKGAFVCSVCTGAFFLALSAEWADDLRNRIQCDGNQVPGLHKKHDGVQVVI